MTESKFYPPQDSYDQIVQTIKAYPPMRPATRRDIKNAGGPKNLDNISRINSFLMGISVLEGNTRYKQLTASWGRELASALRANRDDEVQVHWRRIAESNDFLRKLTSAIGNRRRITVPDLQGLILDNAGAKDDGSHQSGAGAIIKILEIAGLIILSRGKQESVYTLSDGKTSQVPGKYVNVDRVAELSALKPDEFDLTKLIELCVELNRCYTEKPECVLAIAILVRAVVDHIPPIFGCRSFTEVANNYSGGGRSFKEQMERLDQSSRKIANACLHQQIRKSETLPTMTQVNFSNDLDTLLGEIVRKLKQRGQ